MNGIQPARPNPPSPGGDAPGATCTVVGLLRDLPALVMSVEASGIIGFWNEECRRALGYHAEDMVGVAGAMERLLPDAAERARMMEWWRRSDPNPSTLEIELVDAAAGRRTVAWHRLPCPEPGPVPGWLAVGHDLTPQRRSEHELRESRERLRTAFENVPLDFWIMSPDGRYAMVNPAAVARWGNHLGKTVSEASVPADVRAQWSAVNARAFAGETVRGEVEYSTGPDSRAYEYVVAPIRHADGHVSGILGVNIDITERKSAERHRERSEATKTAILDALPDLMFRMSADGRYLDHHAPPGFALLTPPHEFIGRRVRDVIPADLADLCVHCIERTLTVGGVQRYEYSVGADPPRHYEVRMSPCARDEVVVLVRNISDIKQTEQSLRESESRYRALFDSSPLGLFVIQDGRMAMTNSAGLALLGAGDRARVIGREAMEFVAEKDRAEAAGCVATALRDGRSPPHVENLRRLDGSEVTVEAAGARIELGGRPAAQVIAQDVTQGLHDQDALREADEQLRQSQKMEAVGQLAAGVAHDFNNLLTAIFGYVSLARSSLQPSSPAWTALDGVQAAAEQASGVIRSLLAASRKAVTQFTALDLVKVAEGAIELLRAGLPSAISLEFDAPPGPVPVRGDETLLKQVVLNLAINARDAMPRGGTLRVVVRGPGSGRRASLRVEDTGEGIPPAIRNRIFEPFFTTKNRDSSSGLGLSIAEGIVRSHGGTIEVESAPGRGASFTVWLPAQAAETLAPREAPPAIGSRSERVLVVDETRQVREVIGTALARAGFGVHYAGGTEDVSFALAQAGLPIDLAIINVDMPEGAECVRRVRAAASRADIVALTASVDGPDDPGSASHVLRKPFQVAQIPDLVRRVLAERAQRRPKETPP